MHNYTMRTNVYDRENKIEEIRKYIFLGATALFRALTYHDDHPDTIFHDTWWIFSSGTCSVLTSGFRDHHAHAGIRTDDLCDARR